MRLSQTLSAAHPITLLVLATVAACGGEMAPADRGGVPDTGAIPTSDATAGSADGRAPAVAEPQTSQGTGGDSAAAPDGTAAGGESWTTGSTGAEGSGQQALLTAVRSARHDGYDRIVFEFEETVPSYRIEYAGTVEQCGSGRPVSPGAPAALHVVFPSAVAHDQQGSATVEDRSRRPGLPVLRTAQLICDFEGRVEWVLGLERKVGYRASTLESPPRLVIDLRHP